MSYSAVIAAAASALLLAACGGSSGSSGSSGSAGATRVAAHADVNLRSTKLGDVLVDRSGHTLYLFEQDTGATSTCSGPCAAAWPPVTVHGTPTASKGVAMAKLGTTKRPDGTTEITYAGHPLYTFAEDGTPGQTEGQGQDAFGAEWYALKASGDKVDSDDAGDDSSSGSGGSGY